MQQCNNFRVVELEKSEFYGALSSIKKEKRKKRFQDSGEMEKWIE